MKTEKQNEMALALVERGATTGRKPRATAVRTRCAGKRTAREEVEAQVVAALPQIVRANVKKAQEGSLQHTRWLWGVVEKMPKQSDEAVRAKQSLAALLLEQLGERL